MSADAQVVDRVEVAVAEQGRGDVQVEHRKIPLGLIFHTCSAWMTRGSAR